MASFEHGGTCSGAIADPSSDGSFRTSDTDWGPLYGLAAFAAVLAALMTPIAIAVFVMWPPPYEDDAREVVPVIARL